MRTMTVRLAMLCMAIVFVSACRRDSQASTPPTFSVHGVAEAAQTGLSVRSPVATSTTAPSPTPTRPPSPTPVQPVTFAVIGDGGSRSPAKQQVADMVNGWKPDFIVDTGDAYYASAGGSATDKYDRSVGAYYCNYLKDVTTTGGNCPHGNADRNRFFPTLGNHDYSDASLATYLKYFNLPGAGFTNTSETERYYDFTWGPVHFFSLNSNSVEPDGVSPDSKQGQWLRAQLAESTSPWNIVFFHHPPYSSGASHGSQAWMQWPFKDWGAQAVFSGHEHLYERLQVGGVEYFVNGTGGGARYAFKPTPVPGSQARDAGTWGAQKVTASEKKITFEFYTVDGQLADSYTIEK